MKEVERNGVRTWIEIDTQALAHNHKTLRGLIPASCKLMSVAKSNAYGHGIIDFSTVVEKNGVDWIGVDSVIEAIAIREAGVRVPVLVLGYTLPELFTRAADLNISIAVSTFETLSAIKEMFSPGGLGGMAMSKLKSTLSGALGSDPKSILKIHIKVDTGMHRQGFQKDEMSRVLGILKELAAGGRVVVEGLFTHFAAAKNPAFPQKTNAQLALFEEWTAAFTAAGFSPIKHACASGGALLFPQAHFDMVRMGIAFYGLWPSKETELFLKKDVELRPILSWKTLVSEVKNVPKGDRVGYDFTEEFKRDSKIAICPIGYWHGYPRALSGIGHVLVRGKKVRVLGRVSMDMITIDVTDVPGVSVGDEVVLIGQDGREQITAEEVASAADVSVYELVTRLNPLIRRLYR